MSDHMTITSALPFWSANGYQGNPLEYNSADQEDDLPQYFISPQYFASVLGDPLSPNAAVVFAPRGGGKTAQRRMVELNVPDSVLTITYSDFPLRNSEGDYDLMYHLWNINQRSLIGLLTQLALEAQTEEARKVARFFAKVGLPVQFGQLSLTPQDKAQMVEVMEAAIVAPMMANEPFVVTTETLIGAASQVNELGRDVTKSEGDVAFRALHDH